MEFKVGDKCKIIKRDPDNTTGFKEYDDKNCYIEHIIGNKYCLNTDDKDNNYVGLFSDKEIELIQELDLLEQAKLKYPVGTKYKCPENVGSSPHIYEVKEGDIIKYWDSSNNSIDIIGKGYLYYCGKWAEIISTSEVKQESKSLVGRYLKALVNEPQSTTYKIGDIVLLTKDYRDGTYLIEGKWTYTPNNKTSSHWILIPEGFTPDSIKPQFEVDKWYKGEFNNKYIKVSRFEKCDGFNKIYYTELIKNGQFQIISDYWASDSLEEFALNNPVNLSEIQQYLPDGHPDKLVKTTEWIPQVGDWIYLIESYGGLPVGTVAKINESQTYPLNDPNSNCFSISDYVGFPCMPFKSYCRKAEPHEIPVDRVEAMVQSVIDQPKFKIGDKVKAIDESGGWGRVNPGDIGVVKKNDLAGKWKYSVDFTNQTDWSCKEKDLELYNESKMTVTFNPSQNAVSIKLNEYPVTPKEAHQVIGNLKSKKNSNRLDTYVKSTYVSLPEVKKKSKTIKF